MISAYTIEQISALRHQLKARKWLKAGLVNQDQHDLIVEAYPSNLYRVKLAMAVLLFLGGTVGVIGLQLTIAMSFLNDLEDMLGFPTLIMGLLVLVFAEWLLIREQCHYRTGLLQAVYLHGLQLLIASSAYFFDDNEIIVVLIALTLSLLASLRYMDRFALASAFLCFGVFVFQLFDSFDGMMVYFVPVFLALCYGAAAFWLDRLSKSGEHWMYRDLINAGKLYSLILMYVSVNVLVVSSGGNWLMNLDGQLPFAWLFITLTVLLPATMFYFGWKDRDRILLNIGGIGVALSVLSIKLYFEMPTNEFVMAFVGVLLVAAAILLIRHFSSARNGISSASGQGQSTPILKVLEAAQAFQQGEKPNTDTFGGGDFGGGGAEGKF
jgi:uncharacterized membrane protein YgcG